MSPALRALIDADNQRPGPSEGVRTGVYAALGVSLGVIPAAAIATAEAATTTAVTTSAASTTAASSTAAAVTPAAAATSTVVGAAKVVGPLAFLAKTPLIGVGIGAVLGATLTAYVVSSKRNAPSAEQAPPAALVQPAEPVAPAPPVIEPVPAAEPATAPPAAIELPRAAKSAPARRATAPIVQPQVDDRQAARVEDMPKAPTVGELSAEQSLLDPARAALAREDGATALARLALHERRFPAGLLAQEREAMAIHALVLTGARADAERRAASFRSRYPGSLLAPTVDATLRSRP
jgi:hypothetical protein